jgi:phosphate starvation-inducible PhoH-like protein
MSKKPALRAALRAAHDDVSEAVKTIFPRTKNQKTFMEYILNNNITFGMGSAGTGKTYVATVLACQALQQGLCDKIIICRPIVEAAGERIGFLPGSLEEKCDPYIQPMSDVINEYFNPIMKTRVAFDQLVLKKQVEVQALAFMRGRSYKNAWILCDEAQNMNANMMKMLVTRYGENCKMIITGDPKQRDRHDANGFEMALSKLSDTDSIKFMQFTPADIVRHKTVQDILTDWPDE